MTLNISVAMLCKGLELKRKEKKQKMFPLLMRAMKKYRTFLQDFFSKIITYMCVYVCMWVGC